MHRHDKEYWIYFLISQFILFLIDLVALSVEGDVYWSDGEFVFVNGGDGQLVFMDGSNGQVFTLGLETGLIGGPGQCEFLAFRGNPVRRSLVGVANDFTVRFFSVRIVGNSLEFLLDLGFFASGVVRLSVAPLAAAIDVALIGLAGDGDVGVFVILVAWRRVAWCRVAWCFVLRLVAGSFVLRPVASSSDGQDSGDDKQLHVVVGRIVETT
uniref:Uncharacterized protein n=1 Tax=Daphnia magna TaxID=35525 RepID=A0A0P5BIH2_9CRUS